MAIIEKRLWEGVLSNITKDDLYKVVRDFCVGSSCAVSLPIETAGHYHLKVWGITIGKTKRSTLDPPIATVTLYETTKRLSVRLNDLESVQSPSEDLVKFLNDLPFGVRDRVEYLVWWILDKYVGRTQADAWQHKQNLATGGGGPKTALEQSGQTVSTKLTQRQVSALGKRIGEYFNENELRDLTRKLSLDYENLSGDNKLSKAQELVDYTRRHDMVAKLLAKLDEERPHVDWSQALDA